MTLVSVLVAVGTGRFAIADEQVSLRLEVLSVAMLLVLAPVADLILYREAVGYNVELDYVIYALATKGFVVAFALLVLAGFVYASRATTRLNCGSKCRYWCCERDCMCLYDCGISTCTAVTIPIIALIPFYHFCWVLLAITVDPDHALPLLTSVGATAIDAYWIWKVLAIRAQRFNYEQLFLNRRRFATQCCSSDILRLENRCCWITCDAPSATQFTTHCRWCCLGGWRCIRLEGLSYDKCCGKSLVSHSYGCCHGRSCCRETAPAVYDTCRCC